MKIAIPAAGVTLESMVNETFGRTETFIIVDDETMAFRVMDNKAANAQGGAGIVAAQAIVDSGANVVITFRLGQKAADVLKAANVKIMKALPGTLLEMVDQLKKGELQELAEIHAGYHNHGGA